MRLNLLIRALFILLSTKLLLLSAPEPYAEPTKTIKREHGKTAILKCSFGIRNFLWSRENSNHVTEGTWYKDNKRIMGNKRLTTRTKQKGKARYNNVVFY